MKRTILPVILLLLCLVLTACGSSVVAMSANDLVDEFGTLGAHDMNKKYKEKPVEITGKVFLKDQFRDSKDLYIVIWFDAKRMARILAIFPESKMTEVNNAKTGDLIKVKGIFQDAGVTDKGIRIDIKECSIVK